MVAAASVSSARVPVSHARIVETLGRRITAFELAEGDSMTVAGLEEEFSASRTVVREAVRALEAHGLVSARRRVGLTVRPRVQWRNLDATVIAWTSTDPRRDDMILELTALRGAVEPIAARAAALHASDDQRARLLALATRLGELGARGEGDTDEYLSVDIDYHSLLLSSGGNALFAQLAGNSVAEVLAGRAAHGLTPGIPHVGTLEAHLATARAISERDAAAAEAAAREHLALVSTEVGEP